MLARKPYIRYRYLSQSEHFGNTCLIFQYSQKVAGQVSLLYDTGAHFLIIVVQHLVEGSIYLLRNGWSLTFLRWAICKIISQKKRVKVDEILAHLVYNRIAQRFEP